MRALASGGKYFSTYFFAERFAQLPVGGFYAALPAWLQLVGAGQVFAVEGEVLFHEGIRKRIGGGVQ